MLDPHRIYLRAELAKLRNDGDARDFLDRAACDLAALGLPGTASDFARLFADQHAVDAFVHGIGDAEAVLLTECCDRWRENGIASALSRRSADLLVASVGDVYLRRAESSSELVFERHAYLLVEIAKDRDLLAIAPYSSHARGEAVDMPICIAEDRPEGGYRLFDGMHRAIQLARNDANNPVVCPPADRS